MKYSTQDKIDDLNEIIHSYEGHLEWIKNFDYHHDYYDEIMKEIYNNHEKIYFP